MSPVSLPRPIVRSVRSFLEAPASVRSAIRVIVIATVTTTLLGAVLVWVFDSGDFPSFGGALWWSLQTVTTVGYGDITPTNGIGRLIGAVVLLYSVAFLSVLTAAITTSFVDRARRDRAEAEDLDLVAIADRLDRIDERLARLEQALGDS